MEVLQQPGGTLATEDALAAMFVEDTGRSILDSGSYYGRHFEANRKAHPKDGPSATLRFTPEFRGLWEGAGDGMQPGWITLHVSLYHYLAEHLSYEPEWDRRFQEFAEDLDESWGTCVKKFGEFLESQDYEVGFDEGEDEPYWINSYNGDNNLSQDFQYCSLFARAPEEEYGTQLLFVQVHNGCDIRGGYTGPRVFSGEGMYLPREQACVHCENDGKMLSEFTDPDPHGPVLPGVEWPREGDRELVHRWYLEEGKLVADERAEEGEIQGLCDYRIVSERQGYTPGAPGTGVIVVDSEEQGYCPVCGGRLLAWAY